MITIKHKKPLINQSVIDCNTVVRQAFFINNETNGNYALQFAHVIDQLTLGNLELAKLKAQIIVDHYNQTNQNK